MIFTFSLQFQHGWAGETTYLQYAADMSYGTSLPDLLVALDHRAALVEWFLGLDGADPPV